MKISEVQEEILRLKKEKDFCVLAHAYQGREILEIADYVGDSYGLSVAAKEDSRQNILMCGVRFMAETCKILSPEKTVYLANPMAGCPMADQLNLKKLGELKEKYPDYTVVAYINTTAELKTGCDICVTSSSAVKICGALDARKILFVPDPNLGAYVSACLPEKEFVFAGSGCPRHAEVTAQDVLRSRSAHPDAALLVHPECRAEVSREADYVGSTTGIMEFAKNSDRTEFIIGTENSIAEHLQFECPNKRFYPLSVKMTCMDMRVTTLPDVLNVLKGEGGEEINLGALSAELAGRCLRRMMELGG